MKPEREPQRKLLPESLLPYETDKVLASIRESAWFNPQFLEEVMKSEPYPDREEGWGKFKDTYLGDFLLGRIHLPNKSDTYTAFWGISLFLTQRMIGEQGHPFPLASIEFVDEELLSDLAKFGITRNWVVDRGMIGEVQSSLLCLIAPEELRRKVARCVCGWNENYPERKKDVIAWSQVVKAGAIHFVKTRWEE